MVRFLVLRRFEGVLQRTIKEPNLRSNMLHQREVGRKGAKVLKENIPAPS